MAKTIIVIAVLIITGFIIYRMIFLKKTSYPVDIKIKDQTFQLEVAKSIAQKSQGLMNRTELAPDQGMIFVSTMEIPQAFWMKNTLIPLDIIFLDKSGKVINIAAAVPEPGVADLKLTLYKSDTPAKYVIELPAGTSEKIKLVPGDIINLPTL